MTRRLHFMGFNCLARLVDGEIVLEL